jgi:mevalonate kinase
LTGEHFAVLGAPAVAMAINLYSTVQVTPINRRTVEVEADIPMSTTRFDDQTFELADARKLFQPLKLAAQTTLRQLHRTREGVKVNVECEIPIGAGLGSSASINVAIISGVSKSQHVNLGKKQVSEIAFTPENVLHGKSSGVDQATCAYGGIIQFQRPFNIRRVRVRKAPNIIVCDTGIHHSTRQLVGSVLEKSKHDKNRFVNYIHDVRGISQTAVKALETGDYHSLGYLMYENHELLKKVGVSHPMLDKLVNVAKKSGALGAKLTGAGGGGCIIALCETKQDRIRISRALRRNGGLPYDVIMDLDGVKTEFS